MKKLIPALVVAITSTQLCWAESYVTNPYLKVVQAKIRNAWKAPDDMKDGAWVKCTFDVQENGQLSNIAMEKSKDASPEIEQAALTCLQKIGSVPELPTALKERRPLLPVVFKFRKQIGINRDCIEPGVESDLAPYLSTMQRTIKRNWAPTSGSEKLRMTVAFEILEDGTVKNAHVAQSSGNKEWDKLGLAAVSKSGKLAPLPDGSPEKIDIQFTFDKNTLKK